jgi:hypothetical protein
MYPVPKLNRGPLLRLKFVLETNAVKTNLALGVQLGNAACRCDAVFDMGGPDADEEDVGGCGGG